MTNRSQSAIVLETMEKGTTMKAKSKLEMLKRILGTRKIYQFPFTYLGNKAVLHMANDNITEVTLQRSGTHGQWNGLLLTIVNPRSGQLVTANGFSFEQYLGNGDKTTSNGLYVWEQHDGFDWYGPAPRDTKPIVDAVINCIWLYSKED